VVVAILLITGVQLPLILFTEIDGNGCRGSPMHTAPTKSKSGTIVGSTVTINVKVVAHCPSSGVKI